MTPQADDNFDDSTPLRWWTPTEVDLVNPFTQQSNPAIAQRARFQELPPGTIVGESYEVGERLGAGSMGEVYAARHMALGKHVAIKVIGQRLSEDDRAIGRFVTEARILAQIQHPAIVTVDHVGALPDGRAYFVMEHLRGESLSARLSRGRVPSGEALRILDQMARGLAAAHVSGVVHRDLKPDNTFLVHHAGEKPAIKLLDFGLAKLTAPPAGIAQCAEGSDEGSGEDSDSGRVFGTPLYMSPEQARGFHLDPRSDIYALGCVAYELVLGARPFPQAQTITAICAAHLHEAPPLPRSIWPEIPPQLDRVLFAMLAKDPADRPTLAQLRSVVMGLRASTPPQQRDAPILVSTRQPQKRAARGSILGIAAIGVLVAGAMLGAAVSLTIRARSHNTQAQFFHPPYTQSSKP